MPVDLAAVAAILTLGNVLFRHFEPRKPLWRRALKVCAALACAAILWHFFGRKGVWIGMGVAFLPVIYVHGIWLPRRGVNGWTGEPRDRYYQLRGWTAPPDESR